MKLKTKYLTLNDERGGIVTPDNVNDPKGKYLNGLNTYGNSDISTFGYSGTTETNSFPLRQFFTHQVGCYPSEWNGGYLKTSFANHYLKKNKDKLLFSHYMIDGKSLKVGIFAQIDENGKLILINIFNRNYYDSNDEFGVALFFVEKTKKVDRIIRSFIRHFIPEKIKIGGMHILESDNTGFSLKSTELNPVELDFDLNYNEDFKPHHDIIVNRLSVENSKGLVLLSGLPGTGKTTYIRYLTSVLTKRIIYIPPNLVNAIADPGLIKFFMKVPNSILLVEDGENILAKRQGGSQQAVSNILNLTDGILSDCMKIQVIATFNSPIATVDPALLRKGRLITSYEFKELTPDRADKLRAKLGVEKVGKNILSDIYNVDDMDHSPVKKQIGF